MSAKYDVIVIGGSQAGLTAGYFLARSGVNFVILDANQRIGDAWRQRWDSLRLFTPARYNGLVGMPYPARKDYFPTKDEMADFLEAYARHFNLPVRTGVRVNRLWKRGEVFIVEVGDLQLEADNVVIAMAKYQKPKVPAFAAQLDPAILQLHSSEYCNPAQLKPGGVLIVGAGNSGAEIAIEVVHSHPTWLSGRSTGEIPFTVDSWAGHAIFAPITLRLLFHRVLSVHTPMGRKMRPKVLKHGGPLIRTKMKHLKAAGVEHTPRMVSVQNGKPVLADGRTLEVANVIWATGYQPGLDWIDLPILGEHEPRHARGVVREVPGLYFTGLAFQTALSSTMIQGLERDARYVTRHLLARRANQGRPAGEMARVKGSG